jgi:hypothetical protein
LQAFFFLCLLYKFGLIFHELYASSPAGESDVVDGGLEPPGLQNEPRSRARAVVATKNHAGILIKRMSKKWRADCGRLLTMLAWALVRPRPDLHQCRR